MDQKRLIIWVVFCVVLLLGWNYLFPAPKAPQSQNGAAANSTLQATPAVDNQSAGPQNLSTAQSSQLPANTTPDAEFPRRSVSIVSPIYEAKLDSKGAVTTSWVIKKNKDTNRPIFGSNRNPLELVSPEGLQKGEAPFRLVTGDPKIDEVLNNRTYKISVDGADVAPDGDIRIDVSDSQQKRIEFSLRDAATGLEAVKIFRFNADLYGADLEVKVARNGEAIPRANLTIGPSIGDQSIPHYTFYSVAPEAVWSIGGAPDRRHGSAIHESKESADFLNLKGNVDWGGVGDTYFAMVAVPSAATDRIEYRTVPYEHVIDGKKEARYLVTGYVPVSTTGALTRLYVGPKDHYILTDASKSVDQVVGKKVDLEGIIDYGWLSSISRPLAVPILWSIKGLHSLTNSYGLAIIFFTIIIYSLFFPLKWRSSKAMKKAQKLAPRMKELQEKMKGLKQNDPRLKDLQMEQLRLMKEGNPLGGCLPLLIQMPFLFALYRAITISIDFRHATFLWLPDLSAADPYHLLPILMAGSMLVLQLITPAPSADPLQRKMMAFMMPAMMLWFMWSAPAGLLVYWLVGNVVGFSQQFIINRLTKSEDDEQPPEKKSEKPSPKKLATTQISQASS